MKFLVGNLILLLTFPFVTHANTLNAGFVDGLWYSQEHVFVGDTVRIYVALRNNTESDLTGTVRFFDNGTRIDAMRINALAGRLVEAWADWEPEYGEHTIKAELDNVHLHTIGAPPEIVRLESALAEDSIVVDYDTDNDGIGDEADRDDDNDGMTDTEEEAAGTDPKVYTEQPTENEDTDTSDTDATDTDTHDSQNDTDDATPDDTATGRKGLEVLTEDSRVGTMLSSVTQTINTAKTNLDAYRTTLAAQRTQVTTDTATETNIASPLTQADTGTSSTSQDVQHTNTSGSSTPTNTDSNPHTDADATITRTQLPTEPGFFDHAIAVVRQLAAGLYAGGLAVVSFTLGYPALVEFALLILLLFLVYKCARRFGRRPIDG